MPVVSVGSAKIPYQTFGSTGRRLVLVHGTGPGSSITFGHLVERFTDAATVVMPDLSGSELATDDAGELTVEELARQVIAVVEHSGVGPVDLLGFSLGAPVVAVVAASRPDLVARLILVAPLYRPDDEYVRNLMTVWLRLADDPEGFGRIAVFTGFSRDFLNRLGHDKVEKLALNMSPTPGILRQLRLDLRADIRGYVRDIRAKTLIIGCTRDHTAPVENARELHALIAGSSYTEIDSGHVVVFEQPGAFVEAVKQFVAQA